MSEDHPSVDIGEGIGDIWTGKDDVDLMPLCCDLGSDSALAARGWVERGSTELACPVVAASPTLHRVQNRLIAPTTALSGPSGALAEGTPGEFGGTEGGDLSHLAHLDFSPEEIGLSLNDQRGGRGSAVGPEEVERS
jgi:hypothetical protein